MWTAHPKCFSWDTSDTIHQKVDRKHLQPKHGENVLDDIRMTVNTGLVLGMRTFADSLKNFQASSRLSRSKLAQRMLGKCKFYSDPIYPYSDPIYPAPPTLAASLHRLFLEYRSMIYCRSTGSAFCRMLSSCGWQSWPASSRSL
jgi:hypothetical protein